MSAAMYVMRAPVPRYAGNKLNFQRSSRVRNDSITLRSMQESHRVAIIGAGPIGLELAVALKQAGVDYIQFDASQIGSTIAWYPPQMLFHSRADRLAIAGVPIQVPDQ